MAVLSKRETPIGRKNRARNGLIIEKGENMGDQLVKDFFDLDMKEKMQLIESRKKIEKELVRMVYAPVLMMYTSGLERQYNRDLNGIVSAAKEDIQVVGKQIDQSVTGQFAKSVKTTIEEKTEKFSSI